MQKSERQGAILFLLNKLDVGGSQRKTVNLANDLARRGRTVLIAYLNSPATLEPLVAPGVPVFNLQRTSKFSPSVVFRIVRLVRAHNVRNLIAISLYPALYASVSRLFLVDRTVRFLASVNTTEFGTRKGHRQMAILRHALNRMDIVIFGAESQRAAWRQRYGVGRAGKLTAVLYNGVDPELFRRDAVTPAHVEGWSTSKVVVGTVGRLAAEKAQGHILSLVAELRRRGHDVGALIVGSGPEEPRLASLGSELGIANHVHLVQEVEDVRPYLAAMSIFVLSSVAVETFSNAALEAMAMSLPVVSSDIGGMKEMLQHGGGVLYPPGDLGALREQVERLIIDDDHRCDVGNAAREAVVAHFGTKRMVDSLLEQLQ